MATWNDDFNRGSLGSDWTAVNGTFAIGTNRLSCTVDSGDNFLKQTAQAMDSADNWAEADIHGTGWWFRVLARYQLSADTGYYHQGTNGQKSWITKRVAGTPTNLKSSGSQTWGSGETAKIDVSGTTITIYKNGTSLTSVTDSSISTGLYSGLGSNVVVTDGFDNFQAGDYTPPAPSADVFVERYRRTHMSGNWHR